MRIPAKKLTDEYREDNGLSKLMKPAVWSEKVSGDQVMKSLRGE